MKKLGIALVCMLCVTTMQAQPRPYEIDNSFVPSAEFMQKSWTGEYDGLEPNSRMIVSLRRKLVLRKDLTYTNMVRGQVRNKTEEVVLRYETGTYQYSEASRKLTYKLTADSTLDVNLLLKGEQLAYVVNHYKETGTEKTGTEDVQFTPAVNDSQRQWVLFDPQLMSPIDSRQKAVYVMSGEVVSPTAISAPELSPRTEKNGVFGLDGRKTETPKRGIYIVDGKKVVVR